MLLDPAASRLPDLYFLRDLVAYVSPALHRDYLIRRVRSRVGVTERAKLARELHDGLLQSLIALEMEIEVLRRQTNGAVHELRLRSVDDQLRQSISEVRDMMLSLRLSEITSTDVLRTLAELAGRLRRESGFEVRLHSSSPTIICPPRTCRHLAKIAQEALTNIRKHSGARSVTIELTQTDRTGRLTIEDDGRGLKFKGRMNLDQLEATDLGPAVIKERVRAMGGALIIDSRPGAGTRMDIEWPADPHV
jgi:signal transduction histidine kinase